MTSPDFIPLGAAKRDRLRHVDAPKLAGEAEAVSEDRVALAFVDKHHEDLRFDHDRKRWMVWNGFRWQEDATAKAFNYARELSRRMAAGQNESIQKSAGRSAFALGVERFAQADQRIAVTSHAWDGDPFLLGTPGGVVDLRTGELHVARREDLITKLTSVAPADTPECPLWLRFLEEATGGDLALIRFLQQLVGYCLTGDTSEQALAFLHGPGGNGKGVFTNTIKSILGDYAAVAAMDAFMSSFGDRHPEELASLRGARLVLASETEEGRKWAEARIKSLTGGDVIRARFMRQDSFEYRPAFKLIFSGNYAPAIQNLDDAIRRRFTIVPFTRRPERPDPNLEQKLRAEWPAILRWAIEGCLDWQRNRLQRPPAVLGATQDYFSEQDVFASWMDERCDLEPGNHHKFQSSAELYADWNGYAKAAGEHSGGLKDFAQRMRRKGLHPEQIKACRGKGYRGIRLQPTASEWGQP